MIGHRVSLLFSQPLFQAAYDLAGTPQCEGNCVGKDFSLRHASLEHKENKRASRYILCTAPQEAQAGAEREEAAAWAVSKSRLNVGPPKKEPRAVHSRGLQLALFKALLSRRLRGCRGTGVSRRNGLLALGNLPDPARAIRDSHHNLEHFEQSRLQIRAAVFPRPSLFGALLGGVQFGRGRECWEDLKKLLFIYVPQRAPAIALWRTVGLFFQLIDRRWPGPKIASNNADGGLRWASLEKERQVI